MKELTEIPNQSEAKKASQKTRSKAGRKRTTTKGSKARAGSGGKRLRDAVNDMVGQEFKRIAKALVDKTCDGNPGVARMVVGMSGADKEPPEKKKKKRGPQAWVTRICSEPEYEGPWEDEDGKRDASKLPLSDYDLPEELK
ncbi:MAG: hypothetical protein ABSA42_13530 [Terracidiphilus sp.]|jgi:hypothetical protein